MRIGLALPHYDFSVPGERPLRFETIVEYAQHAEQLGFDSLWVSDHVFLDIGKYGGPDTPEATYDPFVLLSALARVTTKPRLGTLVMLEALRPAGITAKALASLDRVSGGRLDIGIGAGWYEPDYEAVGLQMPRPGVRLQRLDEAIVALDASLGGGPATVDGDFHRLDGAWNHPPALQTPRPPIIVGGKGDRLLDLVARRADGWNTCWVWTHEQYRERLAALEAACERVGRDPRTVQRSVGLYTLIGTDQTDIEERFARFCRRAPSGVMDGVDFDEWRQGRLVGTVDEVAEQVDAWAALGVEELVCCLGSVPFSVWGVEELELVADTLRRSADSISR
ncbi:MAG: TIGR03619 family F420-dependent LLM class oxidoreductase [Acidimicrobiia bacterium]